MILIADSGSSKTDWRLVNGKEVSQFSCMGLNPDFVDSTKVAQELNQTFNTINKEEVTVVYFYGSGCSSESRSKVIADGIEMVFPNSVNYIYHDLLGAARAACGKNKGVAGILGTGSNCCFFDGDQITEAFKSGGFVLSDEGGGVDIGKRVLKAFVEGRMEEELENRFLKRYKTNVDEILYNLYKKPFPNKYLASFSQFAFHNKENAFVSELIQQSFRAYFENIVARYSDYQNIPLNLVGSIAFYYQEIIRKVALEYDVQVGTILEKPISSLTLYHTELGAN